MHTEVGSIWELECGELIVCDPRADMAALLGDNHHGPLGAVYGGYWSTKARTVNGQLNRLIAYTLDDDVAFENLGNAADNEGGNAADIDDADNNMDGDADGDADADGRVEGDLLGDLEVVHQVNVVSGMIGIFMEDAYPDLGSAERVCDAVCSGNVRQAYKIGNEGGLVESRDEGVWGMVHAAALGLWTVSVQRGESGVISAVVVDRVAA